jgi:HSP20 family protein
MLPTIFRKQGDLTNWIDDFDQLFGASALDQNRTSLNYPRVDVHEDSDNYYIDADLPGMAKKDIDLRIDNNVVTLSGSRDDKREEKKKGYYRLERQTGKFERSFHLGENVDFSKAEARFEQGVLNILLPKKEEAKPKQLDIKIK